jgi:hypothetical protein
MNRYALSSDSRRWWWPSATAGTIGVAAVTALFVLPASGGQAMPVEKTRYQAPTTVYSGSVSQSQRPCFTWRALWNQALDGPEPTCPLDTEAWDPRGVHRTGMDYLP